VHAVDDRIAVSPACRRWPEKALTSKVSVARGHVHQTPLNKNHRYSVGGRDNESKQIGVVDIGTIDHP